MVTGRFAHSAGNVVELSVEGLDEPIGVTASHPFWSEDQQAFIPAGELSPGETLLGLNGRPIRVLALAPRGSPQPVYNLEVDVEHVFLVTKLGVLVHNACDLSVFSRAAEFGIKSYKTLMKLKKGSGLHAHHLIEKRFARVLGVNADDMASIALTPAEHQVFTRAWRDLIPYGQGTANATREQIMNAAREIYRDYPSILKALGL